MENKKSREMTFKELFDLIKNEEIKQQILALLKGEGYTETQISEMTTKEAEHLLKDIRMKYEKLVDVELQKMRKKLKEETPTTLPTKPVDIKNIFREIKTLKEKYNIPKAILFTPDKLEISVERISYDKFHLSYKEFFNYLPNQLREIVMLASLNFLVQMGIPREWITQVDESVGIEVDGNLSHIAGFVIIELLIQKRFEDTELSSLLSSIEESRRMLGDFYEYEFEWSSEIENKFYNNVQKMARVMQKHPSMQVELEAIVKKYTQRSEKTESEDKQK